MCDLDEKYPYALVDEGCFLVVKNGMSGTFKIRKEFVFLDPCTYESSVLCGGSDLKQKFILIDASKVRTGFNPTNPVLDAANFGFDNNEDLNDAIVAIVGHDIALGCCLENTNELTVSNDKIFC